jgi:hypothetical protein
LEEINPASKLSSRGLRGILGKLTCRSVQEIVRTEMKQCRIVRGENTCKDSAPDTFAKCKEWLGLICVTT